MIFFFSQVFVVFMAVVILGWFMREALRKLPRGGTDKINLESASPFLDLDVKPVSEGDEVWMAREEEGRYKATVRNKRKKTCLDLEADSKEELECKVQDTFRAWAITGKKKPGR